MSSQPAFTINDQADQDLASDGISRYGAYLTEKRLVFYPRGTGDPPTNEIIEFALAAWTIATPPIMAPGYVSHHPRIQNTAVHWDDDHRAALAVDIAVPAPPVTTAITSRWREWACENWPSSWYDPYDNDRVTVLTTLTIRVPLDPHMLPKPRYQPGTPHTDTAKLAVATMCQVLNRELDGPLRALDKPAHQSIDIARPSLSG